MIPLYLRRALSLRLPSPQLGTSPHCKTTDTGSASRARCARLVLSFRWYSLRLPSEGWPGWIELTGWFNTETFTDTNRTRRSATSLIKTDKLFTTKPNSHFVRLWRDKSRQERSYRKHIARELHTQYVEGVSSKTVTLKSRLRVT